MRKQYEKGETDLTMKEIRDWKQVPQGEANTLSGVQLDNLIVEQKKPIPKWIERELVKGETAQTLRGQSHGNNPIVIENFYRGRKPRVSEEVPSLRSGRKGLMVSEKESWCVPEATLRGKKLPYMGGPPQPKREMTHSLSATAKYYVAQTELKEQISKVGNKYRVHRMDKKKSEIQGKSFFETEGIMDVLDNHPKNILVSGRTTTTGTPARSTERTSAERSSSKATSVQSTLTPSPTSTSSPLGFLAKLSRLQVEGRVSAKSVENYFGKSSGLLELKDPSSSCLKTLRDCYRRELNSAQDSLNQLKVREKERLQKILEESKVNPKDAGKKLRSILHVVTASPKSSTSWKNWGIVSQSGRFLTASTSAFRRTGNASSLSDILQEQVPEKYFLSLEAVRGMMSRSKLSPVSKRVTKKE